MIDKDEIKWIDEEAIKRYTTRFAKHGIDPKTLGWGSREDQITRFAAATRYLDFSGKSVLDIGCGFSDFYEFLIKEGIKTKEYRGIDITEKLIVASRKRYAENKYEVRNILLDNYDTEAADIVVLFGLLNFKLEMDNLSYTRQMIAASWKITREALIVDFLSTHLTKDYPQEDFVYYHNPKELLDICFGLSNNIVLVHDYPPIPQKEFLVILKKRR